MEFQRQKAEEQKRRQFLLAAWRRALRAPLFHISALQNSPAGLVSVAPTTSLPEKEEMKRQKELQEQRIKEGKAVFMVRKAGAS